MQESNASIDLSLNASPAKKAGVVAQHVLEEMVLYDQNSEMGYSLNASARLIWELCDGERTLFVICDEIAGKLEVEATLLHEDVKTAVSELIALGLLSIEENTEGAD